jgi:transposase InsO family protein
MIEEWAYVSPYQSNTDRSNALADWIHTYNHHRNHPAIGGPPISRETNQVGQHT